MFVSHVVSEQDRHRRQIVPKGTKRFILPAVLVGDEAMMRCRVEIGKTTVSRNEKFNEVVSQS